ncbi:hypothetical protein HPB49_003769 [Dermacentor silvarum]|uniref:Uncharacterized protein n=1 Tax=Dermacentor silvarum TaxID=543639 RepID=A0ACB8DID3_DERSI|nr:hypothetical protein HPB49_003769 [Dermacentor silvarum]
MNSVHDEALATKQWEQPLTTADMRARAAEWSLADDSRLLAYLEVFTESITSRTCGIQKQLEGLIHETLISGVKVQNVINDFGHLSSLQFVENRVYDEEVKAEPRDAQRRRWPGVPGESAAVSFARSTWCLKWAGSVLADPVLAASTRGLAPPPLLATEEVTFPPPWPPVKALLGCPLLVLSASDGVNAEHEAHLRQSAQRASRILRRQCLWGCSRYLMVRELWMSVHVPGLTFANSTICLTAPTRDWLERGQREVGRLALGCHGRVAVEAIQGDVGWSSFEAREAKSKIAFECRLRKMDDGRWARRVFRYVYLKGIQTQWRARVQFLRRKYGLLNYSETGGARCETAKGVQDHVRETERELWKSAMASKTTLRLYCDNKGTITPEPIYDNSGGSAFLFEARAGALRTLDYRSRFDCAPEVQAAVCRVCGSERETAEHLVLNCAKLSPTPKEGTTMPQALGFLDAEGGRCFEVVATTKARLERWWRAVKQSRTVPGVI